MVLIRNGEGSSEDRTPENISQMTETQVHHYLNADNKENIN